MKVEFLSNSRNEASSPSTTSLQREPKRSALITNHNGHLRHHKDKRPKIVIYATS